jgi:FdhD protein
MSNRAAVASIIRIDGVASRVDQDLVAVETPLAIEWRANGSDTARSLGVFMRTPGHDEDLVRGMLFTEGVIRRREDVQAIRCEDATDAGSPDTARVDLAPHLTPADLQVDRATIASSACGLCGRLIVDVLDHLAQHALPAAATRLPSSIVCRLPEVLRDHQTVFAETGGLHAAGLFDLSGRLLQIREDVGRHNALDKLVGAALASGELPASDCAIVVSGRVAFEIVQKTVMAGVPILIAVGAPSSLAVTAARRAGLTLAGFVRDRRFNIYSGRERIAGLD